MNSTSKVRQNFWGAVFMIETRKNKKYDFEKLKILLNPN
jgi:hypothetical protein